MVQCFKPINPSPPHFSQIRRKEIEELFRSYTIEIDLQQIATKLERKKFDSDRIVHLFCEQDVKDHLCPENEEFAKYKNLLELKKVHDLVNAVKAYMIKSRQVNNKQVFSRRGSTSSKRHSPTVKRSLVDKVLFLRQKPEPVLSAR